jgi:predicted flap endonuclease-1-like 5' DNA nuclease
MAAAEAPPPAPDTRVEALADLSQLKRTVDSQAAATSEAIPEEPLDAMGATEVEKSVPDDLRQLPEIGPVYERLLHANGITTYAQLARMTPTELQAIFVGNDPESGYPVIPMGNDVAGRVIRLTQVWSGMARHIGDTAA